jgi:hypothetical protein
MDIRNKFVLTRGCGRVWCHDEIPDTVRQVLVAASKWGGSDKREGRRVSYEIRQENLMSTVEKIVALGMVMANTPETMEKLCE